MSKKMAFSLCSLSLTGFLLLLSAGITWEFGNDKISRDSVCQYFELNLLEINNVL